MIQLQFSCKLMIYNRIPIGLSLTISGTYFENGMGSVLDKIIRFGESTSCTK